MHPPLHCQSTNAPDPDPDPSLSHPALPILPGPSPNAAQIRPIRPIRPSRPIPCRLARPSAGLRREGLSRPGSEGPPQASFRSAGVSPAPGRAPRPRLVESRLVGFWRTFLVTFLLCRRTHFRNAVTKLRNKTPFHRPAPSFAKVPVDGGVRRLGLGHPSRNGVLA